MKPCLVLVCLFAVFQVKNVLVSARAVEAFNELDEDEKACVEELGLEENRMQRINSQDITPEDDTDFNNFIGCSWKKAGLQKPNGKIDYEALAEALHEVMAEELKNESIAVKFLVKQTMAEVINECKNESPRGKTFGQTAVKVQNCVMSKLNKLLED